MGWRDPSLLQCAQRTLPYFPAAMSRAAAWGAGHERCCVPAWQTRLYRRAAFTIWRLSQMLWLTGFSTYTCFPACMAMMEASACQWFGVATTTASSSLSSRSFLSS